MSLNFATYDVNPPPLPHPGFQTVETEAVTENVFLGSKANLAFTELE